MWVVECLSYPNWKDDGTGNDRVTILEDTDGDGKHDKRTVFFDKGVNLTGIEVGFGGVWLTAVPNLIFIPDTNGDDKPDGPPQVLLDGWDLKAKHNVVGNLAWGPDGWLYGCNGILSNARSASPARPTAKRVRMNCGVWRYHPARHEFEAFAHGTTNPWGLDWDEHGQMFITNCVIKHLFHVVPGGHFERMFGQDLNPHTYGLIESCADHQHWAGGHWTTLAAASPMTRPQRRRRRPRPQRLHDLPGRQLARRVSQQRLHAQHPRQPPEPRHARARRDRLRRPARARLRLLRNDPWFRGLAREVRPRRRRLRQPTGPTPASATTTTEDDCDKSGREDF